MPALGLGALLALGLLLVSDPGEAQPAFQTGGASEIFIRQCAPCHGVGGEGTDVAPGLTTSQMPLDERVSVIINGSNSMPAFGSTLIADQVDELVEFLATLQAGDEVLAVGSAVYAEQCARCHGDQGEGGLGPSLLTSTTPLGDQIAIIRDGRGGMPAYGSELSDLELEAVAAFGDALRSPAPDAAPPVQGAHVYKTHCASCHGSEGAGGLGPNLRTASLSRSDLIEAVMEGRGTMPAFTDRIDSDELDAVVAFLEELAQEGQPAGPAAPPLVEQGAELFTTNCARCHGPDARGGFGPSLKYSTLTDVEMVSVISNGFGAMPAFEDILTSAESTALVAYVESTRGADTGADPVTAVAHGRDVYVTSCATCHGFDGTGGVAPSLANTRLTANEIISQVFGIHADRMPAFEGVLDASQVQDVARYVLTVEGESRSQVGWLVAGGLALVVLVGVGLLWYAGLLDRLVRRFR